MPLNTLLASRIAAASAPVAAAAGLSSAPAESAPAGSSGGAVDPFGAITAVNDAVRNAVDAAGNVATDAGGRFVGAFPDLTGRGLIGDRFPGVGGFRPPILDVPVGPIEARKPSTQLAQNAVAVLRGAGREALNEAIQRARAKQVPPERLIDWLERKTRIGEVLSGPASGWSQETVADFAQAFQMAPTNLPVMDALVAIAVLNWPDLEGELRQENTAAVTGADLLQNRRIVYQYPPAGTPLEPPYVILVAVEHQDTRKADEVVASILGNLAVGGGYKMPREAAAKVG